MANYHYSLMCILCILVYFSMICVKTDKHEDVSGFG